MFGQKKNAGPQTSEAPHTQPPASAGGGTRQTLIARNCTVEGKVSGGGDLRLEGTLRGKVSIAGRLIVGPEGLLETPGAHCASAEVSGRVRGPLQVDDLLHILPGGELTGEVTVCSVVIDKGGRFDGSCRYAQPGGAESSPAVREGAHPENAPQKEPLREKARPGKPLREEGPAPGAE